MLHVALLCLLFGQVPPPPAPRPPDDHQPPVADQAPSAPQAQREWLLTHLIVDMQAQGKYDGQKYREIERMLNGMSDSQLGALVQYYQDRKAQVLAQAEADLHRLEAYRDYLKREVERRKHGQVVIQFSGGFAAPAWPYYASQPYYYPPHHHRHW